MPDEFIDLTVTSPPYDGLRTYGGNTLSRPKFKQVARELLRVTKAGGVVVWVVGEGVKEGSQTGTSSEQRLYFRDIGFTLWDRLVMARHGTKSHPPGRYGLPLEEAFVLSKGEPAYVHLLRDRVNKHGGEGRAVRFRLPDGSVKPQEQYVISHTGARSSVWRYAVGRHVAEEAWVRRVAHGALMPEKMAEDLILSYSKPDALVFDPFCGLATTCKMALLNHRRYLGMEVCAEYHRLAVKRMTTAHTRYLTELDALLLGA